MMSTSYTPSSVLGNAPQLQGNGLPSTVGGQLVASPFAPGTVINQSGVLPPITGSTLPLPPVLASSNGFPPLASNGYSTALPALPVVALSANGMPLLYQNSQAIQTTQANGTQALVGIPAPLSPVPVVVVPVNGMATTTSPRPSRSRDERSQRSPRSRSRSPQRTRSPAAALPVEASSSEGLSAAASDLASKLFSRGVIMLDQIVVRDQNGQVAEQFIKGITKYGDKVLVLLDQGQLEAPNVEGSLSGSSTMVPYSLKTGAHQCSKSELCGVAFDCQGEICTLIRKNGSLEPREITFKITGEGRMQMPVGIVSSTDAINAYPVVLWSELWGSNGLSGTELRAHKLMMLNYIDVVSQRINAYISRSVDGILEKTVGAAQNLRDNLAEIDRAVFHSDAQGGQGLRQDLENAVKKLRGFSEGYHKMEVIPDEYQASYKATEVNLYHRKEYQRQLTSLVTIAGGYGDIINNINEQLSTLISQIAKLKSLNATRLVE